MSRNGSDRDLEKLFESAREADRLESPSFGRTWDEARRRALSRSRRGAGFRLTLGAALAAAAIVAGILLVLGHRVGTSSFTEQEIAMAREISEWAAPSDRIAALSGLEISAGVPNLEIESVELPEWSAPQAVGPDRTASSSSAIR